MRIVKQPNHRPSLIEYTAQIIREALSAREWIEQMPGERELSQQLHVSRPTLRAALALLERDGLLLRQPGRRRGIVKPARLPVRKSPKVIGLLAPGPFQEIVPSAHLWLNSLQSHLRDKGYDIQIHSSRTCYSQSPERELAAFTRRVPALVWVLFLGTERMQRWFMESGLLCVTSGTPYSGVELPSVDLDHRATCRHADTHPACCSGETFCRMAGTLLMAHQNMADSRVHQGVVKRQDRPARNSEDVGNSGCLKG